MLLADRIAAAAAVSSAAAIACALLLWSLLAGAQPAPLLVILLLVLPPPMVAAAAWVAARMLVDASLAPAVEALHRFAAQDFSAPAALDAGGTRRLGAALEALRAALAARHDALQEETDERAREDAARQAAIRVHSAVARLMGAAVSRLSQGDLTGRVTVKLPQPYVAFQSDFNAAMERLETAFGAVDSAGARLHEQACAIEEASAQLACRTARLAGHLDAELAEIETDAGLHDPERALRRLLHTMNGVRIAAERNARAAEHFAGLGRSVACEAGLMLDVAGGFGAAEQPADAPVEADAGPERALPAADVPATLGALALKLES